MQMDGKTASNTCARLAHFSLYHLTDQEADEIEAYLTKLWGPDSVLPKSPADMPE